MYFFCLIFASPVHKYRPICNKSTLVGRGEGGGGSTPCCEIGHVTLGREKLPSSMVPLFSHVDHYPIFLTYVKAVQPLTLSF